MWTQNCPSKTRPVKPPSSVSGRLAFSGKITYQVVTGALGSGKVGPRPPPLLVDLPVGPACDLRMAGGTKVVTDWGAAGAPGVATPGAAKGMLNAEGC